jgi:hypothetical protein
LSEVQTRKTTASQSNLPAIQSYDPTTFLERGVALPFTTPFLGGTRARPGEKRGCELVVPSPSGGRGVYIMPWPSIASLCRPTVHDRVLNGRIATLDNLTPATIRRIAREIAAEGLAGEAAMEAARIAIDKDKDSKLLANYRLLMALIEQFNVVPASSSPMPDLEQRAKLTIAWVAPRVGQSTTWVAAALEALSDVLENIGVASTAALGRNSRLTAELRQAMTDIAEWGKTQLEEQASVARMICQVMDFTLTLADALLGKVRALTQDMLVLLKTWAADPEMVIRSVNRPEWLLDGWEPICLIWNYAWDDAGRRAALAEIAGLIPILPREVKEWCGNIPQVDGSSHTRRVGHMNEDWRTGAAAFDLIARNEHFRAVAY